MDIENHRIGTTYTYMNPNDSISSVSFSSNISSDFSSSTTTDDSDDLIRYLVSLLDQATYSTEVQKQAAMEIRLLSKNQPENRSKIAKAGAIRPLISLISSSDPQLQEYGVTAILNLSLCDANKELIASSGAIKPLITALKTGTSTAKENAACALLRLSQTEENKIKIGRFGAIPLLVNLLETGGIRAKKDASTALYSLCSTNENKIRAVQCGIMKPLVVLMADFESNMVDKSVYVMNLLMSVAESKAAVVEEGGVAVLVEIVEVGTQRQKEVAVSILLKICEESVVYRTMVAREGVVPPLVAMLEGKSTSRGKEKVEKLIELLRQPRGRQEEQEDGFDSNENESVCD